MQRGLATLVLLVGALFSAYAYRAPLSVFATQAYQQIAPCSTAISYSLGAIDPRFGISEEEVIEVLHSASDAWSTAIDRELFRYQQSGGAIMVNFIYDDRQQTTNKLASLGITVSSDKAAYDTVQAEYKNVLSRYEVDKAQFTADTNALRRDVAAYQAEVARVNERGGATPREYERLQEEKASINARQDALETRQVALNEAASDVNAMVLTLNRLAKEVNAGASVYNAAAGEHDEEFEEAVFRSAPGKQEISVYEFDSRTRLTRVLSHEFGHALGLDHIEDENALMYRLNQGTNQEPIAADVAELKRACRVS